MGEQQEKINRAKAFCLDSGLTENDLKMAWGNVLLEGNKIIENLDNHGKAWWWLPPHLLKQLSERYGGDK